MIVPMLKYNFLIYHRDFDQFLTHLQELGVVDIERSNRSVDDEEKALINQISRISEAVRVLETREVEKQETTLTLSANEIVDRLDALQKQREQFENAIKKSQKELAEVKPWGDFDIQLVQKLADKGIKIRFFVAPEKSFTDEWLSEYPIEAISSDGNLVYFVLIDNGNAALPTDAQEIRQPQFSAKVKEDEIAHYLGKIDELDKELDFLSTYTNTLKTAHSDLLNKLEFKVVSASAEKEAENTVMVLQGWVPENLNDKLVAFLNSENVIYLSEKAQIHDNVPILLKNNRFAKLFEPISRLFALPIYAELDLTPFFAPFFMLFFGFCLGDAGYGIIFILGATLYKFKAKPEFKPILSLIQFLGIATVLFGALTGTVFGVSLIDANIPALKNFKTYFFDQDKMFKLSLGIGLVQIIFGMCVKAGNLWIQNGWKHAISTISWIIFIVSSIVFYALSQNPENGVTFSHPIYLTIAGVSALGIFFFNSPGKNPFFNFGLGLWDSYNMATGLLGDTLSYIRLFALGLSSGILGSVFNSLAFGMAPDIPIVKQIVIVLILLIGHSINIFMSALGSLVHPMRLTFVEFYKNAGFAGGGREYTPFQRKILNS
ncbi:MAG: V-type ATP synthase subunit I [Bacteroidales bacterium]|nr:V-type ATP synthase subunit I [Bacteroidales bacterium]HPD96051.1 hypothetical protein [Tenuifilaceae bacterium]HRX31287.1 hypothetical protein [Tenuifilaceae bacterium]